jgi:hypothetical protein
MKKRMSILIMGFLLGTTSILAQEQYKKQGQHASKERMHEMNEKAKEELQLSDEQAKQWDKVHQDFFKENQEIMKDESLSNEDKKAKQQNLRKNKDDAIKAILNDDQFAKYLEKKKEMRMHGQNQKGPRGVQKLNEIKTDLNLSGDQTDQWDAIVKNYGTKMKSIKSDNGIEEQHKKSEMKSLKGAMEKELMAILTKEQQVQFKEEIQRKKKERAQQQNNKNRVE